MTLAVDHSGVTVLERERDLKRSGKDAPAGERPWLSELTSRTYFPRATGAGSPPEGIEMPA